MWDRQRLWALELPVTRMSVAELEWQLDLPLWRHDGRVWSVTPREVAVDPGVYREQFLRTVHADLAFPIDVTRWRGHWTIVDASTGC